MDVKMIEMSQPKKVTVVLSSDEVKERKVEIYKKIQKDLPQIKGFRKGHIPQDVAENHFKLEELYRSLFDEAFRNVKEENKIVSGKEFRIFGDLKNATEITMEFVAEMEPTVVLAELDNLEVVDETNVEVTEDEIEENVKNDLKQKETMVEIGKASLDNLDVALIDYVGSVDGKTFQGGTAKDYHLVVNVDSPTFVDTFEKQMIGMAKGETRTIEVTFPQDYRQKDLAGKLATFVVTLKAIKEKVLPELNDDFAKVKGFETVEQYRESLKASLLENKQKNAEMKLKQDIIAELLKKSDITPVPLDMIDQELERQWFSHLSRIGKKEDEFLKEVPNGKEVFVARMENHCSDIIKTTLILRALQEKFDITATKEDVVEHTMNLTTVLNYDEKKKENIMNNLESNPEQYKLQKEAILNERTVTFLVEKFKNATN